MSDDGHWFVPKRYGYGAGLPIAWQGWAVLGAYVAIVVGLSFALHDRPVQLIAAIILPTIALILIAARRTRGGWRWRWGDKS